jgi:membrane protein
VKRSPPGAGPRAAGQLSRSSGSDTRTPSGPEKPNAAHEAGQSERGRDAENPSELPARGWRDILLRTKREISADNLSVVAAGVAFYAFLAVVPSLAAVIAIYGLVSDPNQVSHQIAQLARALPQEVLPLLEQQMTRIASNTQAAGWSAIVGFLLALYSSANATKALITGLNIAYGDRESRGFLRLTGIAFVLTIGGIVGAVLAIGVVAVLPAALQHLPLPQSAETWVNWLRWPLLIGAFMFGLAVMYRFGPSRHDAKWKWVSWGAAVAGLLWLAASGAFSLYVAKFGSYDKTYGSLGAVIVFMMWLYLSAFVVLLGAELNSEMERQTAKDTTRGPPKPMGRRQAHSADTLGPAQD